METAKETKRRERSWARESPRDMGETAFTPILRKLLLSTTGLMAVCFVDDEGECIDYCSALDPFDTKVVGAHMAVVVAEVGLRLLNIDGGVPWAIDIHASDRDFMVRRLGEDYVLVVVMKSRAADRRLLESVDETVRALCEEAGIPPPALPYRGRPVRVETRDSSEWEYAPEAFFRGESRVRIEGVIGRWTEQDAEDYRPRVCFRVRTASGEELTLVHRPELDRWERPAR